MLKIFKFRTESLEKSGTFLPKLQLKDMPIRWYNVLHTQLHKRKDAIKVK